MTRTKLGFACAACFLLGWLAAGVGPKEAAADPAPPAAATDLQMAARLGGNAYLQNSAEYRACCLGIYRSAELRLEAILSAGEKPAKPAVAMDLDETVLDNSAFQTFLYKNKLEYDDALWARYEDEAPKDVGLVPGAKRFIDRARERKVAVVFISNRSEKYRERTASVLERLNVAGPGVGGGLGDLLLLRAEGASGDKSARREAAASRYNVLMYFGDNLRDFSETFARPKKLPDETPQAYALRATRERNGAADGADCHWGVDWFVLPNPVYGEWDKLVGPDPVASFRPTSMATPEKN